MQGMQIHLRPYICLLSLLFLHLIQSSGTLTESACVTLMIDWSALISYFIFTLLQQTYGDVWKGIFRISFNRWLSKIDENFTRHWISIEPIKCTFYFWFYNSMLICALSMINFPCVINNYRTDLYAPTVDPISDNIDGWSSSVAKKQTVEVKSERKKVC